MIHGLVDPGSLEPLGDAGAAPATEAATATIDGHRVALLASAYDTRAGTLGSGEVRLLADAVATATRARLPIVSLLRTGGVRLTEGVRPFAGLRAVAGAFAAHRRARLPHLVHLGSPSTGGALATWGTRGDLTWAEPGAVVALTGPAAGVEAIPAEACFEQGLVDGLVTTGELRPVLATVLDLVSGRATAPAIPARQGPEASSPAPGTGWQHVLASRRPGRTGVSDVLRRAVTDVVALRGDRLGNDDDRTFTAACRFGGRPAVVVGTGPCTPARAGSPGVGSLRKIRRAYEVADTLDLPIVTLVDVAGPGEDVAHLAGAIGDCATALQAAQVPAAGVLVGEGGGGVALACLPATVVALDQAWLAPIAPERAAAVLGHAGGPAAWADGVRIGAAALLEDGIVDCVVPSDDVPGLAAEVWRRLDAQRLP